jgi:hypothetical protein
LEVTGIVESRAFVLVADDLRGFLVLIVTVVGGGPMEHLSLLEPFGVVETRDVFVTRMLHG